MSQDRTADRLDIAETLYRYAQAVDLIGANPIAHGQADPVRAEVVEILRTCLTDDGEVYLLFFGPGSERVRGGEGGPESFAAFVRDYFTDYGYVGTFHVVGNIRISFTGDDTAFVKSYINSEHWMADGRYLSAPIEYEDQVVRCDDGLWRVTSRDIVVWRWWVTEGYAPEPTDPTLARPTQP